MVDPKEIAQELLSTARKTQSAPPFRPARPAPRDSLIIVSRTREAVFRTLQEHFREDKDVRVVWDRRVVERRSARMAVNVERRRADRRGPSPETWDTLGIMVWPFDARGGP